MIGFGAHHTAEVVLECLINDYLTFIVLLFGTLLSSWVGTTGASMLMVRPIIKMNSWRKRKRHIMIFFIFLISNIGGCLTPIGDPPLLMGFMRGVPFFWSLRLLPILKKRDPVA